MSGYDHSHDPAWECALDAPASRFVQRHESIPIDPSGIIPPAPFPASGHVFSPSTWDAGASRVAFPRWSVGTINVKLLSVSVSLSVSKRTSAKGTFHAPGMHGMHPTTTPIWLSQCIRAHPTRSKADLAAVYHISAQSPPHQGKIIVHLHGLKNFLLLYHHYSTISLVP